jgi:hypothetical protein
MRLRNQRLSISVIGRRKETLGYGFGQGWGRVPLIENKRGSFARDRRRTNDKRRTDKVGCERKGAFLLPLSLKRSKRIQVDEIRLAGGANRADFALPDRGDGISPPGNDVSVGTGKRTRQVASREIKPLSASRESTSNFEIYRCIE